MKSEYLQLRYSELCVELGHLVSNIDKLQARVSEIKKEISVIDEMSGRIKAMERLQAGTVPPNVMPFKPKGGPDNGPNTR